MGRDVYRLVRRALDEEIRTFGQYSEGEGAHYVFDGEHREHGEVQQRQECYRRVAARLGLTPERVQQYCPGTNYRQIGQRGHVLFESGSREEAPLARFHVSGDGRFALPDDGPSTPLKRNV